MRKIAIVATSLIALLICFIPVAAATPEDVSIVTVNWQMPQVGYWQENNIYYYGAIQGYYDGQDNVYEVRYILVSHSSNFSVSGFTPPLYPYNIPTIYLDTNDSVHLSYSRIAIDGSLMTTNSWDLSAPFNISYNLGQTTKYAYGLFFYYDSVNTFPGSSYAGYGSNYGGYATDRQFIIFAQPAINQVFVRSVLPRPVQDDYNRFVVLTGVEESHLLWLNYRFETILAVNDQTSVTYDHYDIKQSNYYAPTFRKTDNGFGLRITMDPLLYLYLNNVSFAGTVSCSWYLSDYNLVTGEFVSMLSGSFTDMQPDSHYNIINDDLQFDAIGIDTYGIDYNDISSDHLHRAAVIYSVDPTFDNWMNSSITWLERIYYAISATESSDDVTIDSNTEAASELHNVIDSLQPTDSSGNKVDTAEVVSEQFSDAAGFLEDIGDGAEGFNSMINDFIWSSPLFYMPLIVALALGLLITILGKNKSD